MAAVVATLKASLQGTLSPKRDVRVTAEKQLAAMEGNEGFAMALLGIVHNKDGTSPLGLQQAAVLYFKNLVKRGWTRDEGSKLTEGERSQIKSLVVDLMCVVPESTRRGISDALTIISEEDFPLKWPTLLDHLVARMGTTDFKVINGILETAHSVFRRFRHARETTAILQTLKHCLEKFQVPLQTMFKTLLGLIGANAGNKPALELLFKALRIVCKIFFALNCMTIPEYFEDNIKFWMAGFLQLLQYTNPLLVDEDDEMTAGPIEQVQAAVVENVALYAGHYEEEFSPFFGQFVGEIWKLLTRTAVFEKYDELVTTSMKFLISVVSKKMHEGLFSGVDRLTQIITSVVVPNLTMRENDEDLFEDNPTEYIQRDMEGSDKDTRRRIAATLVRETSKAFPTKVTQICVAEIGKQLAAHAANPAANWKSLETAITLYIAIAVEGQTRSRGVSKVNSMVNVPDFFVKHIQANLAGDVNATPIVKAACIKFVTTFRNQLPKAGLVMLLPVVANLLRAEAYVVHTYAALAVERMLTVKERLGAERGIPLSVQPSDLKPLLAPLLGCVFDLLCKAGAKENEYVVKCLCRIVYSAKAEVVGVAPTVLSKTAALVAQVAKDPKNPRYNHNLFECLAALTRNVLTANPKAVNDFETALFPTFNLILGGDIMELMPYVFQIMALLLALRPGAGRSNLSEAYKNLLLPLLAQALWKSTGNVPALTQLMEAYCRQGPDYIVASKRLVPILGVMQLLVNSKATEQYGFRLLTVITLQFSSAQLAPYMGMVFKILIARMKKRTTGNPLKFRRGMVEFAGLLAAQHGPEALRSALDSNGAGYFMGMTKSLLIECLPKILGGRAQRAVSVGVTRMLTEMPDLLSAGADVWVGLLTGLVTMLETSKGSAKVEEAGAEPDLAEGSEYTGTFSQLAYAYIPPKDAFAKTVPVPAQYLAKCLNAVGARTTGVIPPLVERSGTAVKSAIARYCTAAGVALA